MATGPLAGVDLEALRGRRSAKWTFFDDDVLPAWVAEMDFAVAPAITDVLRDAVERSDLGYSSVAASGLFESFARFAARRWGWEPDPARALTITDAVVGVAELIEVLSDPGDGIALTVPTYHPFFRIVAEGRRRLVEVPLHDGGDLDVAGIERAFAGGARVLLLCNPQNPTGRVVPAAHLEAIAAAAERHDAWVIADEIHAPLVLPGAEHTVFASVSEAAAERGFLITSASKAFNLAGLKCALAVAASDTAWERLDRISTIPRYSGHLGVLAAKAAFDEGDEWLAEVVSILDRNRELLARLLAERLPDAGYLRPEAGYLAWLDFSAYELGADPAAALLQRGRIALSPGPQFGTGGERHARLNFATSPEILTEAVERIASGVAA